MASLRRALPKANKAEIPKVLMTIQSEGSAGLRKRKQG